MAESEKQSDFAFELDGGKPAKHLSRSQKKFGQLLKEVEKLRARQQRLTALWESFLKANREPINRFSAKIQATLARIWGEEAACAEPQTGVPS